MTRWLAPLGAAVTVLVLLGGWYWLAGPASRGGDGSVAGPGEQPGSVQPGFPGTPAPGDSGTPAPGDSTPPPEQPDEEPGGEPGEPIGVPVDSYSLHPDQRHLSLRYTIGVPECYGRIGPPQVEESAHAVTVTLTRHQPSTSGDTACIDLALLKKADVTLAQPLGARMVRDGSQHDRRVPRS